MQRGPGTDNKIQVNLEMNSKFIFIFDVYSRELPPRTDGQDWVLKYSTSQV